MTQDDIAQMMQFAVSAILQAGQIANRHFRTDMQIGNKLAGSAFDPVTQADTGIETFLREALSRRTPGLGIVGEEFGATGSADDYWIIDPIDGTRAFMSGMPTWGILLGLVIGGKAVGGIMHQPFTGETFMADPQNGSRLLHWGETTPLRASTCTRLADAILYSTDPVMLARGGIAEGFDRLATASRMRRWGGDCYAFALVALGTIDIMVEGALAAHDIVPLIAIIEGAGGIVTTLDGASPLRGGNVIAAGNAALHAQAIRMHTEGLYPPS
jgi:myo-inositol-1(or 4)-monophosphatase